MNHNQIIEHARELIMNDPDTNAYVQKVANNQLHTALAQLGQHPSPEIKEEMLCQYQVNVWNKVLGGLTL